MKLTNSETGEVIELEETNDVSLLKNQLNLLGMKGLFYSEIANKIREKIKSIENI